MVKLPTGCPSCREKNVRLLGSIPDANEFAGRHLSEPLPGGSLYECEICGLWFRYPLVSESVLTTLYGEALGDSWDIPAASRVDWQLAAQGIGEVWGDGKVLDIGCHDGRFLASLPVGWKRYGIEMGQVAAGRAQANGTTIIGPATEDLDRFSGTFDVVTAFDLFEHVSDPLKLLKAVAAALVPGGKAFIATGNTQSLPFRLLGSKYAYCICAEHLAFLSPDWIEWASRRTGLEVERVTEYRRSPGGFRSKITDTTKAVGFRIWPGLFRILRHIGVGGTSDRSRFDHAPLWPTATDHFLVVLRKNFS